MKFLKGLLYFILFLSALLMAVLFLCAWKPEVTQQIAAFLFPDQQTESVPGEGQEAVLPDSSDSSVPRRVAGRGQGDETGEENAESSSVVRSKDADSPGVSQADTEQGEEVKPAVYIPPDEADIVPPKEVAGKNGCRQIQGNDSQIEDEEARELEERVGVGETGEGLTFDPLYYPYYDMLDDAGQQIYRQIYANADALNPTFTPVVPISAGALRNVIAAVYNDHPELFWLDTAYSCKHLGNGACVEINLQFNRAADNPEAENAAFDKAAQDILTPARDFADTYDKERYVHDQLMQRTDYVRSAEMSQSAYSALVNGRTVCAGYARAFQYLMQQLGVPCYYCTGYAGEDHAWNIIKLEDGYYNVDVTWDDTGEGTYDYFNKTDEDYAGTHMRQELSVYLPPCGGGKYRSANVAPGEEGLRSSADVGIPEDAVLQSLPAYYDDCYAKIIQKGPGDYTFSNVLQGEELYRQWEQAYDQEQYKEEYMIQAMRAIGVKSCHLNLSVEKLQQDRYLITHEVELR